jgi:hypothetical protein
MFILRIWSNREISIDAKSVFDSGTPMILYSKKNIFKLQKVMKTNLYIVNVVTCKLAKIQDEILSIMGYTKLTI